MNDDKLGDRIIVSEIESGGLPHPQDPWGEAPSVNTPFTQSAARHPAPVGAETSYDPRGATLPDPLSDAQAARAQAKASSSALKPQPTVAAGVRPTPVQPVTSAETATLRRFREVFGLKRVDVVEVSIPRLDPNDPTQNVEIKFGLRGINYDDYQWVLEKTREMIQDPSLATFAWKAAFISMGVASIDGEPLWSVFGIQPENSDHIKDHMYPHMGLRFQAADALCEELRTSFFDLIEQLYSAYEAKVDTKYLPKKAEEKKMEGEGEQSLPLPLTDSVR